MPLVVDLMGDVFAVLSTAAIVIGVVLVAFFAAVVALACWVLAVER